MPSREPKSRLHLGDLGAADGNPVRYRAIKLDNGTIAFPANETDVGNRDDVAAVHANEQIGIELSLGFRNRPRTHPLAGPVMNPGVMRVRPDAADIGCIDEMRAAGALDGKLRGGCRPRRLA